MFCVSSPGIVHVGVIYVFIGIYPWGYRFLAFPIGNLVLRVNFVSIVQVCVITSGHCPRWRAFLRQWVSPWESRASPLGNGARHVFPLGFSCPTQPLGIVQVGVMNMSAIVKVGVIY